MQVIKGIFEIQATRFLCQGSFIKIIIGAISDSITQGELQIDVSSIRSGCRLGKARKIRCF